MRTNARKPLGFCPNLKMKDESSFSFDGCCKSSLNAISRTIQMKKTNSPFIARLKVLRNICIWGVFGQRMFDFQQHLSNSLRDFLWLIREKCNRGISQKIYTTYMCKLTYYTRMKTVTWTLRFYFGGTDVKCITKNGAIEVPILFYFLRYGM